MVVEGGLYKKYNMHMIQALILVDCVYKLQICSNAIHLAQHLCLKAAIINISTRTVDKV